MKNQKQHNKATAEKAKKQKKKCLAITHPSIASEWHPTLNKNLSSYDVTYGSGKKVWWQCNEGHEWEAIIKNRTSRGNKCPYCTGKLPIVGENDLGTVEPWIAVQWNYNKNHGLTPQMFKPNSGKIVWWMCTYGHEWEDKISNRTLWKCGCPYDSGKLRFF